MARFDGRRQVNGGKRKCMTFFNFLFVFFFCPFKGLATESLALDALQKKNL